MSGARGYLALVDDTNAAWMLAAAIGNCLAASVRRGIDVVPEGAVS